MIRKLGNIVAQKSDLRLMNKVSFIHYTEVMTDIINDIPTLIIGWNNVKRLYPDTPLSILKEKIDNKTWWCFSPQEKNTKHIECVSEFYQTIIEIIKEKIPYHFINIFELTLSETKEIISTLNSNTRVVCYVHYNFMYVYINNEVLGFNLEDIEYLGIPKNKILKYFYNNTNNSIFYKADFLQEEVMQIIQNNLYLIPIFYEG